MLLGDILRALYAPRKAFKQIVENPKYLGALLVLLLFIGVQLAFEFSQFSKVYFEETSPNIGELNAWTVNSTLWRTSSGVVVSTNPDFINYTVYVAGYGFYSIGNSSLQFDSSNSSSMSMALSGINVDCGPKGFQNLSMGIKIVQPQATPQQVTLTLYSVSDANYFTYDLTPDFNAATLGIWNNLTVPVGSNAPLWVSGGSGNWSTITALKLDAVFPANSNITMRFDNLFFRGLYKTPIEADSTNVAYQLLYNFFMQYIFEWLLLAALLYLIIKGLKGSVTWKPLFVAVGFALSVLVVRGLIYLAATLTLPQVYYPFELSLGVSYSPFGIVNYPSLAASALSTQAQAAYHNIDSITMVFQSITSFALLAAYVWLGALCTIVVRSIVPEFSTTKRIFASVVSMVVMIILLLFFLVGLI